MAKLWTINFEPELGDVGIYQLKNIKPEKYGVTANAESLKGISYPRQVIFHDEIYNTYEEALEALHVELDKWLKNHLELYCECINKLKELK